MNLRSADRPDETRLSNTETHHVILLQHFLGVCCFAMQLFLREEWGGGASLFTDVRLRNRA